MYVPKCSFQHITFGNRHFQLNWKRQIRRSSEIAARRRIAANDQKKFTKNYIFETLKKILYFLNAS